jgi:PIN domain nuclease of toxin-antitoxin system
VGRVATDSQPLLLDTSAFIFWHADSRRLSARARAAMMESLTRPVYVSAISAFEIATKVRIGKLTVPEPMLADFQYYVEADGFRLLDLSAAASVMAGQLSSSHRDPFDRLLAAQAIVHECAVITTDAVFEKEFSTDVLW